MSTLNQNTIFTGTGTGPSTPLYPFTNEGSTARVQVTLTSTGSISWEHTVDGTNWKAIAATAESTQTTATTATTSDIFTINASASFAVRANITANGTGMTITGTIVKGGGGGANGGGGGGAITVANGADVAQGSTTDAAVINPALPATEIASLKGIVQLLAAVPANPPPFQLELNDGTSVGDTPAHGFFVKAGGNVAIGSSASGVLPTPVGGVDTAGNVRDVPVIAMNGSPNQTTTFGLLAYAGQATLDAGFYNPVKAIHGVGDGATGSFSSSTGLVAKNVGGTYDVIHGDTNNGLWTLASGRTSVVSPTLTVTASAYAGGNCLGGKLTLTNAMRLSGGTGTLQTITLTDHGNQQPLLDILILSANPAGTFTDHAAFPTMSLADNALVLHRISIVASDWVTIGGTAYCTKPVGALPVVAVGSQTLYAAMNVTSGTPTPAATTDMTVSFGFLLD